MPTLLHLSDIHLAPLEVDDILGDYKDEFVPRDERLRRTDMLRETLKAIGERQDAEFEAVVISGDLTVSGSEEGFELLDETLAELEDALPTDRSRIVIVPGNHDVNWFTDPSSEAHYQLFRRYVRDRGYRTPWLEGIDIDPRTGKSVSSGGPGTLSPILRGQDDSWLLVAINSSNYSGAVEPTKLDDAEWARAIAALPNDDQREVAEQDLKRLRLRDAARLSDGQLNALKRELKRIRKELEENGTDPDRVLTVGVMHHQLLPVSTSEELKSYESIVNLGLVRTFMRANRIDVLLHGHKHEAAVYWDHIPGREAGPEDPGYKLLVISGATIGTNGYDHREAFRLIDLGTDGPVPQVSVTSVPALASGDDLPEDLQPSSSTLLPGDPLRPDRTPRIGPVQGRTISEVYRRVMAEFERLDDGIFVRNLVCDVRSVDSPSLVPDGYPQITTSGGSTVEEWVQELVSWWQRPRSVLARGLRFTHGGRIVNYGYSDLDQLDRAAEALRRDVDSSRAILVLVNPEEDQIQELEVKFPAFCLVQFTISRAAGRRPRLDCTAFFRKQEFRYWWPVNVAEIADLQRRMQELLAEKYPKLEPGGVMTISALAKAGDAVPRVAVPKVDRTLDDSPGELWLLATATCVPQLPNRAEILGLWTVFIEDLKPQEQFDPDGMPIAAEGLDTLIQALTRLGPPSGAPQRTMQALKRLRDQNDLFLEKMNKPTRAKAAHDRWLSEVTGILQELRDAVSSLQPREEASA